MIVELKDARVVKAETNIALNQIEDSESCPLVIHASINKEKGGGNTFIHLF